MLLPLSLRGVTVPALLAMLALLAAPAASAQDLTVYSNGEVPVAGSRQLTAYVPLVINTVTWDVNGVAGGNGVWGTVSAKGLYAAPAAVPTANAVKVRATSTSQPNKSAAVTADLITTERKGSTRTTPFAGGAELKTLVAKTP